MRISFSCVFWGNPLSWCGDAGLVIIMSGIIALLGAAILLGLDLVILDFEEAYEKLTGEAKYKDVLPFTAGQVHNGYFSQDKKGVLKDTKGDTQADEGTYALIMKDKERLLDVAEPLRFIFSHSALREGWDNPNVFQICTLNETSSLMKKRQEIGRGLRLPVDSEGRRIWDQSVNVLTVSANESYDEFARTLQNEIEDECGVDFSGRIKNKRKRKKLRLKKGYALDENFKALWDRIQHKTRYRVDYSRDELIAKAAAALGELNLQPPRLVSRRAKLSMNGEGVAGAVVSERRQDVAVSNGFVPDILTMIQEKTRLPRNHQCGGLSIRRNFIYTDSHYGCS
jgi:type III restriction enzyme